MLIALLLVPPSFVEQVVDLALDVGKVIKSLVKKESNLI